MCIQKKSTLGTKFQRRFFSKTDLFNSTQLCVPPTTNLFSFCRNSGVRFWDSTSPLIEEYIRGCQQHYRKDKRNYYACHDGLHAGYIVVGQSTQILLNFMCNKVLADDANHSVAFGNGTCCYS